MPFRFLASSGLEVVWLSGMEAALSFVVDEEPEAEGTQTGSLIGLEGIIFECVRGGIVRNESSGSQAPGRSGLSIPDVTRRGKCM